MAGTRVSRTGTLTAFTSNHATNHSSPTAAGARTNGEMAAPSEPRLLLETTPQACAELLAGRLDIDSAVASGRLRAEGTKRDARRFFQIFRLPTREAAPGYEAIAERGAHEGARP